MVQLCGDAAQSCTPHGFLWVGLPDPDVGRRNCFSICICFGGRPAAGLCGFLLLDSRS